jgi:hypothetical protein
VNNTTTVKMNLSIYIRGQWNIEYFSSVHTFCNCLNWMTPAKLKKYSRTSGLRLAIIPWHEKPHFDLFTPRIFQIAQMSCPSLADECLSSCLVWIFLKTPNRIHA